MENLIYDYVNKKNSNTISLTNNKSVQLSENVIDLNPIPMLIKVINNKEIINSGLKELSNQSDYNKNIYIHQNQEPDKESTIFSSQNAYVPYNNILQVDHKSVNILKSEILDGVKELLSIDNKNINFSVTIKNSWMQKYKSGTFLSPHNHLTSSDSGFRNLSLGYYIDDGDPDLTQSYSGCITFIINEKLFHIRPKPGLLLIWDSNLIHMVNPFFSKSNKDRFMLSCNLSIEINN